ncbi:Gtr1/RagA G protein conserved region-domain-containing protein [Amylostereum chailletii]|nr:Gtr1/RagA G protein conserved region-domain-containing protein [Amylostereum chailletii]
MKKKVLLMGASGSGKTSMRSLIFSNNPASLTSRLGATIDVEQNHVRFLGDLILNLWDCGGQDAFMDSYLSTQRSVIFQHVGVLIYVFDVKARDMSKDLVYYHDCIDALQKYSPDASVFLLVHKMDLVLQPERQGVLARNRKDLETKSGVVPVTVFGTSIYDQSLYKAWSRIVHAIIPNAAVLTKHLTTFAQACSATEVILFERTTFLIIASSAVQPPPASSLLTLPSSSPSHPSTSPILPPAPLTSSTSSLLSPAAAEAARALNATRYERTSELIKALKHSCSRLREEFHSLEMELPEFTAVLDEMTKNTYVLVVVHDPTIETAALKINIRLARQKFEELQSDSIFTK